MSMRPVLQFLVVLTGVLICTPSWGQQDWSVRQGAKRKTEVVARYRVLLLQNPSHSLAYRGLITRLGRGPELDRFIGEIRSEAVDSTKAAPWILLGHLERDRGRVSEAMKAYQRAAEVEPDSTQAHVALGAAHDVAGRPTEADIAYGRALELARTATQRRTLLRRLVDLASAREDFARAADLMARLADERPRDFDLRVELAESELRARRFDAALSTYEAALGLAGKSGKRRAQVLVDIGNLHRRLHDPVAAEQSYRAALKLVGRQSWMRREVLMRLVDVARDNATLVEVYDELRREWSNPSYHDAMILAGLADELGRDAEAVRWLERAARKDRRAIEPRTRLIARLDHGKAPARVHALYDEIIRIRPADLSQRLDRIDWLYLQAGRPQEALTQIRKLEADARGADPDAMVAIAAAWLRLGLADQALRVHGEIEQSHPKHVPHLEAYGELLSRLDRDDEAAAIWDRIFALGDADGRARMRIAEIEARVGHPQRAISLLEHVVENHPEFVDARQRLAGAYEAVERWPEALAQWETLFFEFDVDHAARRILAVASRTVFFGDVMSSPDPQLLQRWEERYRANDTPRTGVVLARLRAKMGDRSLGLALARAIAGRDPTKLPAAQHAAWLEAADWVVDRSTNPLDAIDILRRVAEAFGERRVGAWRRIASIVQPLEPEIALPLLAEATKHAPNDAEVHALVGVYWGEHGDADRAIAALRRAVQLGARSFDHHFDLAFHLRNAQRTREARQVMLDVMRADWRGTWAMNAAFSALDLSETDAELLEIEAEIPRLRGRLKRAPFMSIVVAVYHEILSYSSDPASALQTVGKRALPLLTLSMVGSSEEESSWASELLALFPAADVVRQAHRVWPRKAEEWSAQMVWTLARTAHPQARPSVLRALKSKDSYVREVAIFGIGVARYAQGVASLTQILSAQTSDAEFALAAAALGRIGSPDAIGALDQMYEGDARRSRRLLATFALGLGDSPQAAMTLAQRLGDPSAEVRGMAAVMLRRFEANAGLGELLGAAWGVDERQRTAARRALKMTDSTGLFAKRVVGQPDPEALLTQAFREALDVEPTEPTVVAFVGNEQIVIESAADRLRELNPSVALDYLVGVVLEAESAPDRAPGGVDAITKVVTNLRPQLLVLSESESPTVAAPAATLLPVLGKSEDAAVVVSTIARLPNNLAAQVIARLDRFPPDAVRPALLDGLRTREPTKRAAYARVVGRSPAAASDTDVMATVARLAHDADADVQLAAIEALGDLRHADSAAMLADVFKSAGPREQQAIRASLSKMNGPAARRAAREIAIQPSTRICEGNPEDLTDLLRDACAGAVDDAAF